MKHWAPIRAALAWFFVFPSMAQLPPQRILRPQGIKGLQTAGADTIAGPSSPSAPSFGTHGADLLESFVGRALDQMSSRAADRM